ncbi:MAG TPA: dual specificity protein phosphatase family protein [bacterium]|nr:dual specificity protein phosphatase family protein [bacterium]
MSQEMKRRPWKKTAAYIAGSALAALALGWAALRAYLPAYLAFFQPAPQAKFAQYVPGIAGIEYVARINDGLYRGSDPEQYLDELKKLGIRTIINLRYQDRHDYRGQAQAAGFQYFMIPVRPDQVPTRDQITEFLQIVNDPARQPVYFHCTMGIDRTGLMAGIYRIEHDGWQNQDAVAEMNYFGHCPIWQDLGHLLERYPEGVSDQ